MSRPPKVSVLMITYNHEAYIEQAVRSALMQEADFEYEVVVGEDCSTDGTRAVLGRLAAEFPDRLRVLFRERNLGMGANFGATWAACRGQYIALLEGDDYWTDRRKLATQVGFLDAHPGYWGSAHRVSEVVDGRPGRAYPDPSPDVVTFDSLVAGNPFFTCGVMYRRAFERLPEWHARMMPGDWPLHLLHAERGPFKVHPEVMGAYRRHAGGVWGGTPPDVQASRIAKMYADLEEVLPAHAARFRGTRAAVEFHRDYMAVLENCRDGRWRLARAGWRRLVGGTFRGGGRAGLLAMATSTARLVFPSSIRTRTEVRGGRPMRQGHAA